MQEVGQESHLDRFFNWALETGPRATAFGGTLGLAIGTAIGELIKPVHHILETNGLPPTTAGGIGALGFAALYGTAFRHGITEEQPPQGDTTIDPDNIVFRDVSDTVAPGDTVGDVLRGLGADPDEFDFMIGSADTVLGASDEPIRSTNEQDSEVGERFTQNGIDYLGLTMEEMDTLYPGVDPNRLMMSQRHGANITLRLTEEQTKWVQAIQRFADADPEGYMESCRIQRSDPGLHARLIRPYIDPPEEASYQEQEEVSEVEQRRDALIVKAKQFMPDDLDEQLAASEDRETTQELAWVQVPDPLHNGQGLTVRPVLSYWAGSEAHEREKNRYDKGLSGIFLEQQIPGKDEERIMGAIHFFYRDGELAFEPTLEVNTSSYDRSTGGRVSWSSADAELWLRTAETAMEAQV